jgi:hypothetical protein
METINNLTKQELLNLKEDIDKRLKKIKEEELIIESEINKKLKRENNRRTKTKLSQLEKNDEIFCISFRGSIIANMDYVKINFYKREDYKDILNFSTSHDTKPPGCSSCVREEEMNRHYFLSIFCSSMRFFTLKPETWEIDIKEALNCEVTKLKEYQKQEVRKLKKNVKSIFEIKEEINNKIQEIVAG